MRFWTALMQLGQVAADMYGVHQSKSSGGVLPQMVLDRSPQKST